MKKLSVITSVAILATGMTSLPLSAEQPSRLPTPSGDAQIVTEQPEGELTLYSRTCRGMRELYGSVQQIIEEGSIVKAVEQTDGTIWLYNSTSTFNAQSWIKATKEGDKISIAGPQLVYQEYDYDNWDGMDEENIPMINFYVSAVEIVEYENEAGELMRSYRPTEDGVFTFDINGDTLKESGDGSLILGIVGYNDNDGYFWTGYGDNYVVLSTPQEKPVTVPDNAVRHDNWAMFYHDRNGLETGKMVNVAIDGNDYYIQGIYPPIPEAWVKGTLEGDIITFRNFQYIGPDFDWNYFVYLAGGQLEIDYETDEITEAIIDEEGFALTLESDGTFSALTNLLFVPSPDTNPENANFVDYFEGMTIRPQDPSTFTVPAGPDELYKSAFDGIATIDFNLPPLDANGNLLDTDNLYFSTYVNSKVFTFDPDVYYDLYTFGIYEPTEEIPYNTGNEYDFFQEGSWHTVYIYGIDQDKIYNVGIQAVYYPEGKETNPDNVLKSDIIMVGSPDDPSGIDINEAVGIREVVYHDMQGRRVSNPAKGMFLKSVIYTDGSVKTSKVTR